MWNKVTQLAVLACAFAVPGMASAYVVFDAFGPLPAATFGGSGIPNDPVAITTIADGNQTITIAMNATQRFSNPVVTNDGAGTYFAGAGSNFGGANESLTEGALWNWNYFIDITGGGKLADYQIDILYDFDPAVGNTGNLGDINLTSILFCGALCGADPNATLVEDSQNSMFGFLAVSSLPFLTAPPGSFDPNIGGNYQFGITVASLGGVALGSVGIEVQTQALPEPATVWLFGLGLGLLSWLRRRVD